MSNFNAEIWNIHQLCVLQVLNEKEAILARKAENWPRQESLLLQRNLCRDGISIEPAKAMSQQEALCRYKDQAELKPEDKTLSRHVTTLS